MTTTILPTTRCTRIVSVITADADVIVDKHAIVGSVNVTKCEFITVIIKTKILSLLYSWKNIRMFL